MSPLEYRFYVKRHRDAYPISRVQADGDEAMGTAAETCSTAVGPDGTLGTITDTLAQGATAGSSSGEGGMVAPSVDTPTASSTAQQTSSQATPRAADGGHGAEQAPCQGQGDDATMSDCMEVDSMNTTDAIDTTPTVLTIAE